MRPITRAAAAPTSTTEPARPTRTEERDALLEEALARPGVREAMRVYDDWQKSQQVLETYRETTRERPVVIATDHTNFDPSRL